MGKMNKKTAGMGMGATSAPPDADRWQTRDDVDTILRHEELKDDRKRYGRASSRLQKAARSCSGRSCSSR